MSLAFVDRPPTSNELQKLRLVLSTYQDGTGQLAQQGNLTLPGWRDFERSVALVFGGKAQESKAILDVLFPDPSRPDIHYGVSCKMRKTLRDVGRTGRVTIEVSNSSGKFWNALKACGLNQQNYEGHPEEAAKALIAQIENWYDAVSIKHGGKVELNGSLYLVLQWDMKLGRYQLFQFPLALPDPTTLKWCVKSRRLIGEDDYGTLFEWYGLSGGQLKYYPFASHATWVSEAFALEPIPVGAEYGVLQKAAAYFPALWESPSDG